MGETHSTNEKRGALKYELEGFTILGNTAVEMTTDSDNKYKRKTCGEVERNVLDQDCDRRSLVRTQIMDMLGGQIGKLAFC